MTTGSINYKEHLLPRLRESTEDAGGYIAANLKDNADSPETIALAFQDVIQAYELPIEVATGECARLEREVIEAAKAEYAAIETYQGNSTMDNWNAIAPAYDKRKAAVKSLIDFESSQQQIKK